MCASSQLRLRDCQNIYLFVGCESDPIIEASDEIIVGPYFLSYKGIKGIPYDQNKLKVIVGQVYTTGSRDQK